MRIILSVVLLFASLFAFADDPIPLQNWPVPSTSRHGGIATNTNGTTFVGITPCRVVDTRYGPLPYGGGAFASGETRRYDISAGSCTDVPVAAAYSLNFTIAYYDTSASGYVIAYPAGTTRPNVSTINFGSGPPVANAAIIASALSGQIDVYVYGTSHLIIDINGYFIGAANTLPDGKVFSLVGNVPSDGLITGVNTTTTSGSYTSGVLGMITGSNLTDGSGVMGQTSTGSTWGVKGLHSGNVNNSGGVLGIASGRPTTPDPYKQAGVRGESLNGYGVLGMAGSSGVAGVHGTQISSQGIVLRGGYLGCNLIPVGGGGAYGVFSQGDTGATGTKSFVDPHPTDPSKVIRFVSLEGPEAGTYFRGRGKFVRGRAVIEVPEAFRYTTEEEGLTVHLTPIGGLAMVAVTRQSLARIEAESSRDVEFSYVVYGVRRGYKDFQPIAAGGEFVPDDPGAKLPAYLNEEQRQRLIDNGTYNADGTVNLDTAIRLGWEKVWVEKENRR